MSYYRLPNQRELLSKYLYLKDLTVSYFDPTQSLLLRQVEKRLAPLKGLPRKPPSEGWLHVVRSALGMSSAELARRLGTSRQAIAALEQREKDGSVTLDALSRAADALDCDLVYALIPRSGLKTTIEEQAHLLAKEEIENIAHTMRLEAQGVSPEDTESLIQERVAQLLLSSRSSKFWKMLTTESPDSLAYHKGKRRGRGKR